MIRSPSPQARDLDALLPAILAGIAIERQLDPRRIIPLDGGELNVVGLIS